jgi:hypothetical protein
MLRGLLNGFNPPKLGAMSYREGGQSFGFCEAVSQMSTMGFKQVNEVVAAPLLAKDEEVGVHGLEFMAHLVGNGERPWLALMVAEPVDQIISPQFFCDSDLLPGTNGCEKATLWLDIETLAFYSR